MRFPLRTARLLFHERDCRGGKRTGDDQRRHTFRDVLLCRLRMDVLKVRSPLPVDVNPYVVHARPPQE
jgi:hypothetical protein